jgi:hypothetical protein
MTAWQDAGLAMSVIVLAFVASDAWRWLGALMVHKLDAESSWLIWSRYVATAVLAGVVLKLAWMPTGALALVSAEVRLAALMMGGLVCLVCKRNALLGVLAGQAVVVAGYAFGL